MTQFSPFTLRFFGKFEATQGGVPLPGLHLREGERLLAYLTLHAGEPVASRDLAMKFWPAEAQGSLDGQGDFPSVRQALRSLRQALGPDAERLTRPSRAAVQLDLTGVECDMLAFDRLVRIDGDAAAQAERDAVALYRGGLLDGWRENWAVEARTQRRLQYENVLRRLTLRARRDGRVEETEQWLRLLLASRPSDEEAGRDLLRVLAVGGRHAESLGVLEKLSQAATGAGRTLETDTVELAAELRRARETETPRPAPVPTPAPVRELAQEMETLTLDAPGGAVPIQSPFYIERVTDAEFHAALTRGDSIVLVKGARQVGKTSLLARGLQQARSAGASVVTTDFQKLNADQLATPDALYRALAADIARQLGISVSPRAVWDEDFGPNMNMELFLRLHILPALPGPLLWGLDEVDRLFSCPFGGEVFGLFRSWHNERSLDPSSPLCRLTLAIAYATEAHLFITDPNQSPFNVGTRLALADFNPTEISELNRRYGSPWTVADLARFGALVGGQPYLVRLGLDQAAQGIPPEQIEAEAVGDDGLFGEHLRRLWMSLSRAPAEADAVRDIIDGRGRPSPESFFRLRAAGILSGPSSQEAQFRCPLYASFFARRFRDE
ncbi:MAG: AAA-like domain-containing protein [Capsulimonas sp.]|uniref:AAA-like domain-containing protein n=1 Tax=Capsulimonas sp. TaxID=2494211 RepID=UPI003267AEEB